LISFRVQNNNGWKQSNWPWNGKGFTNLVLIKYSRDICIDGYSARVAKDNSGAVMVYFMFYVS